MFIALAAVGAGVGCGGSIPSFTFTKTLRNASFYSPLNTHSMIAVLNYRLRLAIKVHAFVRVPTSPCFIVLMPESPLFL